MQQNAQASTANPRIRNAQASVRILRKRFANLEPVAKVQVDCSLDTIDAGLAALEEAAPVAPPVVPAPTSRELEDDVIRAALEVRRVARRLSAFEAGVRAVNALISPSAAFEAALDRLEAARGGQ